MNSTFKVTCIVIFGVLTSIISPYIINLNKSTLKTESTNTASTKNNEVAINTDPVDTATPVVTEPEPSQSDQTEQTEEANQTETVVETPAQPVVYDGLTLNELTDKLNRSLKSTLANTGGSFAKYAVEMGIDPYLAVAIVLHETGCNYSCSSLVKTNYNVGGMKGSNGYLKFNTLDEGIYKFMYNLKTKYYDYGLNTAEKMNAKYAGSKTWATKVNNYKAKIATA